MARQHRLHNLKSRVLPEVGKLSRFKVFSGFSGAHLAEKVPGKVLLKDALLCDEVEKVLAGLGPLHHDDEGVVALEVVDEADDAGDVGDAVHEAHLQGNLVQPDLQDEDIE